MGFGHYRISMAIASAANAMGYTPYWMDLNSYQQTTGGKVINAQNELYSLGSRLSNKSKIFNKFIWEPMNYEGFRQLSYNAADQKNAELMTPVFQEIPIDMAFVATHVWPAQAAIHAGMKKVVNAIPDNWPMALHLAEGSLHTVQTHSAYLGYRILNGMQKSHVLKPMSSNDISYTGHYIDHELVYELTEDCNKRLKRLKAGSSLRILLTIGGAGAQRDIFEAIIQFLEPYLKNNQITLLINVGDYKNVWEELKKRNEILQGATCFFDQWEDTQKFAEQLREETVESNPIVAFYHNNIFEAVYTTNLLMRATDVLVTKPSELAFYPVPKLFIKRVGGHEQWGAIHAAEVGDGTIECGDIPHTLQMLQLMIEEKDLLEQMNHNILKNHNEGLYNGAYKVVELAINKNS